MLVVIYSLIAALFAGFHIFSLKYLDVVKNNSYFLIGVILLSILSRYSIYHAMKYTNNPTIVHLFLNFSTFVTFFLSVWLFNLNDFNVNCFMSGLILISFGFFLIQYSYKIKV